jgi:hypothetical protein
MGTHNGTFIRRSLDTRNLEKAAELIREIERGKGVSISLKDALVRFIAQAEANGNSPATVDKYRLIQRDFATHFGTIEVRTITLADLDEFRLTWKMSNTTARKKIERLRAFFVFASSGTGRKKTPPPHDVAERGSSPNPPLYGAGVGKNPVGLRGLSQ